MEKSLAISQDYEAYYNPMNISEIYIFGKSNGYKILSHYEIIFNSHLTYTFIVSDLWRRSDFVKS